MDKYDLLIETMMQDYEDYKNGVKKKPMDAIKSFIRDDLLDVDDMKYMAKKMKKLIMSGKLKDGMIDDFKRVLSFFTDFGADVDARDATWSPQNKARDEEKYLIKRN